jgi:hypothetical protein
MVEGIQVSIHYSIGCCTLTNNLIACPPILSLRQSHFRPSCSAWHIWLVAHLTAPTALLTRPTACLILLGHHKTCSSHYRPSHNTRPPTPTVSLSLSPIPLLPISLSPTPYYTTGPLLLPTLAAALAHLIPLTACCILPNHHTLACPALARHILANCPNLACLVPAPSRLTAHPTADCRLSLLPNRSTACHLIHPYYWGIKKCCWSHAIYQCATLPVGDWYCTALLR